MAIPVVSQPEIDQLVLESAVPTEEEAFSVEAYQRGLADGARRVRTVADHMWRGATSPALSSPPLVQRNPVQFPPEEPSVSPSREPLRGLSPEQRLAHGKSLLAMRHHNKSLPVERRLPDEQLVEMAWRQVLHDAGPRRVSVK